MFLFVNFFRIFFALHVQCRSGKKKKEKRKKKLKKRKKEKKTKKRKEKERALPALPTHVDVRRPSLSPALSSASADKLPPL